MPLVNRLAFLREILSSERFAAMGKVRNPVLFEGDSNWAGK